MNIETKDELRAQSLRFDAPISNRRLFRIETSFWRGEENLFRIETDLAGKEVFPGRVFLVLGEIGF